MNARLQSTQPESYILDDHLASGQNAVKIPEATPIFRRHKLDFRIEGHPYRLTTWPHSFKFKTLRGGNLVLRCGILVFVPSTYLQARLPRFP